MNEPENPFAAQSEKPQSLIPPTATAWGIAVVASMVALLFAMMWWQEKATHKHEMANLQTDLGEASTRLAALAAENQTNQDLITDLSNQLKDLQQEKEMAGQLAKNLEDEMRRDLESKDVAISNLQGRLTITIVDQVMFDSGEAVLKPNGAAVMQKVATLLAAHPNLKIHVIGHTDNVPIRSSAQNRFASNWELSTARALSAVHYLTEQAGISPRRVGAVGYGEFRPVADNATAEGKAKNRRIEITILPDDPAVASSPSTVKDISAPGP